MVLQVSTKTDILIVILRNLLLQKQQFDYDLVNFSLIENINTVNYDLK